MYFDDQRPQTLTDVSDGDRARPPSEDIGPVIAAVDADGSAAGVIATGAALAERMGAPLTVVHSPYPDVYLAGEPYRLAIERGEDFVERMTDGYHVDERVVEADDPATLITTVAREGASLIGMGTRGLRGLRAAIVGSVSHTVIGEATVPVVTVPERALPAVADIATQAELAAA
jgi:nucleotide-binding universal stress UspA family protein